MTRLQYIKLRNNIFLGAYDFFGLNQYSAYLVTDAIEPAIGTPSWEKDKAAKDSRDPSWLGAASDWLYVSEIIKS